MPHHIEVAPTGRAKCRACKKAIGKGELRLGVGVPNAFGEGESLHWFHLLCGAERRSRELLEALDAPFDGANSEGDPAEGSASQAPVQVPEGEQAILRERAQIGVQHPRWTRPARAERASTGRAKCRHCREAIAAGTVRIQLEFVEDGMINPAGFLHPVCASSYLGTCDFILERLARSSELTSEELTQLEQGLKVQGTPAAPTPAEENET